MQDKKNNPLSLGMLIGSMFAFGTIGLFRRAIPLSSALIAFYRGIIGALFLILFVKIRGGKLRNGLPGKVVGKLILTGAMIGCNWILLFEAYNYTSVSVATLCYYMQPTFLVILACLVLHEKMTRKKWLCTAASLVGMILISGVLEGGLSSGSDLRGILLGLAAGALYAVIVLINKTIRDVDPFEKTTIQLGSASIILLPYLLMNGAMTSGTWNVQIACLLVLVGVLHTGICYTLYFASMDGLRTQTVALLSYIDPVTALVLSAVVLHEHMSLLGIVGAFLILGSAVLGSRE